MLYVALKPLFFFSLLEKRKFNGSSCEQDYECLNFYGIKCLNLTGSSSLQCE